MEEFSNNLQVNRDITICTNKYEQAKKSGKIDDNLKEYLDKWNSLGFLDGFQEDRKEELSFAYEQLATFLLFCTNDQTDKLFDKDENGHNIFETIGFVMERKIIGDLKPNEFDFQKFLEYCKEINPKDIIDDIEKLNPRVLQIENEAEAISLCCNMIVEKFNNPNKDSGTIKNEHFEKFNKLIEEKKKN